MTSTWPITSDGLSLVVGGAAVTFAVVMNLVTRERDTKQGFTIYLLEGFSIASSLVVLASLFSRELFEQIGDNKTFLMIVALMTLSYGIRDVFGRFDRSYKSDADLHSIRKREH